MKFPEYSPVQICREKTRPVGRIAVSLLVATAITACEGESGAVVTGNNDTTTPAVVSDDPVSVANDSVTTESESSNSATDADVDNEEAITFLADRTALGAVEIMAVGDSITQGIVGAASYRRDFTNLLEAANCSFTMVGSQQTSLVENFDPTCVDTGVIGDGWGWDGSKSCMVGAEALSDASVFRGAHEGYSSHRADHFLTGLGINPGIRVSVSTHQPDVILLHIGSNDLFDLQSVDSTVDDINLSLIHI